MAFSYNPNMQEAEAVKLLWVRGQPLLQSEFWTGLSSKVKPSTKNENQTKPNQTATKPQPNSTQPKPNQTKIENQNWKPFEKVKGNVKSQAATVDWKWKDINL